jgi:hypothetical protein
MVWFSMDSSGMSPTVKSLSTLAVLVAAGVGIWLILPRRHAPAPPPPPPAPAAMFTNETAPVRVSASAFFSRPGTGRHETRVPAAPASATSTNLITDWQDHVDQILNDATPDEEKARTLLDLLPRFPEAGQVEAAQHVANLIADVDYAKFGSYLTNALTPESLQDVVLADALNRPNAIKLPLLLDTARSAGNAKAAEAREILELYLEEDYGDDWSQWQAAMETWLKDHPED